MTTVGAGVFPQRRTLTTLSLIQVVGGLGNGAGLAVGSLLVKDVSGSSGWAGLATVMLTLGAAATTVPLARLATRAGRRPALAAGWLLGALGSGIVVLGAVASSLPLLFVGLVAMGSSTAANLQSRFAADDQAPSGTTGRAVAIVTWSTTVGAVVGPNLIGPAGHVARAVGVPSLAGPMLFALVGFGLAGLLNLALLRPDPLRWASGLVDVTGPDRAGSAGLTTLRGPALTAVVSTASGHGVMVAVMALTPVHLQEHGAGLEVIGLTISLHIAGMFALSPLVGWLVDGWGALRTIVLGHVVLLAATAVAGTSGDSTAQVMTGLVLLGLGWSATTIGGAALLSSVVDPTARPRLQGRSDLVMNLAGAGGGVLAGIVTAWQGFGVLNGVAGGIAVVTIVLVMSGRRAASELARD